MARNGDRARERDSENRGGDARWMRLSSKRLLLGLCVLLVEPDTKSNSALSLYWHTDADTHTGHKHLSLFLASAGWCLAEEIKPNNRGICLSSRRVPPPHPHMTCPAFIHWAACCQPQDGPLPLPLPANPPPLPGPGCTANRSVPAPMFPPSSNNQESSDMGAWNIHNSHTATRSSLVPSILRGNCRAMAAVRLNTASASALSQTAPCVLTDCAIRIKQHFNLQCGLPNDAGS